MNNKFLILIFCVVAVVAVLIFYYSSSNGEESFDVDSALLKTVIKTGGSFDSQIRVTNTDVGEKQFRVGLVDLEGLAALDGESFELESREARSVDIGFFNENNLPEGVYVGGLEILSDGERKLVPVILEIESEDVLFDTSSITLSPSGIVSPGGRVNAEIRIFDLSQIGAASIDMEHFVKSFNGETIFSEKESIGVDGQVLVTKTVSLPEDLDEGDYVFGVSLKYKDSVGTGSVFLRVEKREFGEGFLRGIGTNVIYFVLFLVFVFFLLVLVFWFIYSRDKLFLELRTQYKTGLEEEDSYLRKKERENARLLKTEQERELNRRMFEQVRREQRRLIWGVHKERVKKLKVLKKAKRRDKMKVQIGKWKKKGYDVRVLEKKGKVKLPTVKGIRKQVQEWKKKGYDVRVLERNI